MYHVIHLWERDNVNLGKGLLYRIKLEIKWATMKSSDFPTNTYKNSKRSMMHLSFSGQVLRPPVTPTVEVFKLKIPPLDLPCKEENPMYPRHIHYIQMCLNVNVFPLKHSPTVYQTIRIWAKRSISCPVEHPLRGTTMLISSFWSFCHVCYYKECVCVCIGISAL